MPGVSRKLKRHHQMPRGGRVTRKAGNGTRREPYKKRLPCRATFFQNNKKPIYKLIEISTRNKMDFFSKALQI